MNTWKTKYAGGSGRHSGKQALRLGISLLIDTARSVLHTGHIGDGKIFVQDVENVVQVRTGEERYDALQTEA